jgi:uncharacterized membrane protein
LLLALIPKNRSLIIKKIDTFLLICIILIYYSSNYSYNENKRLMLDKFCNLFMGMTIIIAGVYLTCTRLEHVYRMHIINSKIDTIINNNLDIITI